jgi:uncharacterized protein involved in exopolysaccharide biosynthesis
MEQSTQRSIRRRQPWLAERPPRAELSRYLAAVRTHLPLIIAFIAAGVIAAFAYVSLSPKRYTAESDLLVTPVSDADPNLVGLPLVRDTSDPTADVLTVAKLVSSPSVVSLVAARLGGGAGALLPEINATPVTQSEIIAVQATDSSPARAAQLANAFAQETVQARTNALHAQLATLIPPVRASMRGLTPSEQTGIASQLAIYETLLHSPDPTLRVSSTATAPSGGDPSRPSRDATFIRSRIASSVGGLLATEGGWARCAARAC